MPGSIVAPYMMPGSIVAPYMMPGSIRHDAWYMMPGSIAWPGPVILLEKQITRLQQGDDSDPLSAGILAALTQCLCQVATRSHWKPVNLKRPETCQPKAA
eukprot:1151081-Pelagomonas_calceolata.AAC.3